MAEGLNRVMLMGNLGADPELRFTQSGQAVLNMRLATTESYVDREGQRKERTEWHSVVLWGKRAEALGKFLTKGSSMLVEGSLRYSSYDGKDGIKRYKTEINARNIILTGRRPGSGDNRGGYGGGPPAGFEQGAPAAGSGQHMPAAQAPNAAAQGGFGADDDDDIPF